MFISPYEISDFLKRIAEIKETKRNQILTENMTANALNIEVKDAKILHFSDGRVIHKIPTSDSRD